MIVGLASRARCGKDTFGKYLHEEFMISYYRFFQTSAFASKLKNMCMADFDLTNNQLYGNEKETIDLRYNKCNEGTNIPEFWTPREIMQALGSFYRSIDRDFWVRSFDKDWDSMGHPDTIITDVRHINECEYVKEKGILIKIVRDDAAKIHGMNHESETALDGKPDNYFDIIIENNGSLEDLQIAASNAAKMILELEQIKEKGRYYDGR